MFIYYIIYYLKEFFKRFSYILTKFSMTFTAVFTKTFSGIFFFKLCHYFVHNKQIIAENIYTHAVDILPEIML